MKICLNCNKNVVGDYKKKFCNRSCAAIFNNKISPKRKAISIISCQNCKSTVDLKKKPDGGYYKRSYCDICLGKQKLKNMLKGRIAIDFSNSTKDWLYAQYNNWQFPNSIIRKHSRKQYLESKLPKICKVCSYDKHVEVCHIKSVKDFSGNATLAEINEISNLVALCPNHHWEFDNGFCTI